MTVSNFLSILRILLIVPVAFLILSDNAGLRVWAAVIIGVAALTDFLDGYYARRLGEVTDLGKILDPVADKVGIGVVAIILALQGLIPAWFIVVVLFRDIAILMGGAYLSRKTAVPPQSTAVGKWTAAVVALTLFLSLFPSPLVRDTMPWFLFLSTVMLAISFTLYAVRFLEFNRKSHGGRS